MGVKNIVSYAFVVIALSTLAAAQVTRPGKCPPVQTVQNFDVARYLGTWYEYQKYPFIFEKGSCVKAQYGAIPSSSDTISVTNTELVDGKPSGINGTAKIVGDGKLSVSFEGIPFGGVPGGSAYWVLDTDYDNYAVVFSCSDILGLVHSEVAWILTRARQPTNETIQTAYQVLAKNKVSKKFLTTTSQENCPTN